MSDRKTTPVETPITDDQRLGVTTQTDQTNKGSKDRPSARKNSNDGKNSTNKQAGAHKGNQ